jgi:hypothetical protein
MNTRLSVMLTFVLSGLVTSAANAQAGGVGANPGAASPYKQQRSQAYTSFDNPYAPGGIYDPYRSSYSSNKLSSSHGGNLQSNVTAAFKAAESKKNRMNSTQMTNPGNGLGGGGSGGGLNGNGGGRSAGSMAKCGSNRLGGNSAAGGAGMSQTRSGMSGSSSNLGHCGSSAYSYASSVMGNSTTSPNGLRGMNGQSTGTQQRQH